MSVGWIVTLSSVGTMVLDGLLWTFVLGRPRWDPPEADVIAFIQNRHPYAVPSIVLQKEFGSRVYPVLRSLERRKFLDTEVRARKPERGGDPEYRYKLGFKLKSPTEFESAKAVVEDDLKRDDIWRKP